MESNKSKVSKTPEDPSIRKVRKKRQKRLMQSVCYEYTQSTSLQGIPYFTKKGLTITERVFWIITFIVSLCMCGYLIQDVWIKWQTSPVIVTVSEQLVPVVKVPFPSITICPQAKCMSSVFNYTAVKEKIVQADNISEEEIDKFQAVSLVCGNHKHSFNTIINEFLTIHKFFSTVTVEFINKVALDYDDIFKRCEFKNRPVRCKTLFSKVLTSSGICFSMNVLAAEEIFRMENIQKNFTYLNSTRKSEGWTMEHGYTSSSLHSTYYPERGLATGESPVVEILFGQNPEVHDQSCSDNFNSLNIQIKHPADLPQASLYSYSLLSDESALLALSFNIMNTSENLKRYTPEIRQCYFPEDRQLKYFKIYTAKNCKIECWSNFTHGECGCVQFYVPHNTSERICTLRHRRCLAKAYVKLAYKESNQSDPNNMNKCKCLPACNSIDYDANFMKNPQNFQYTLKMIRDPQIGSQNFSKTKYSKLAIIYKSPRFGSMRRSELFGVTDFLANCGGLLGLFLGFSFLSLVEIFYFFTLRVYYALRKDRKGEEADRLDKEKQDLNEKY